MRWTCRPARCAALIHVGVRPHAISVGMHACMGRGQRKKDVPLPHQRAHACSRCLEVWGQGASME